MTASAVSASVTAIVLSRDESACFRCGSGIRARMRGLDWSIHHRRPRGAGGSRLPWVNRPANLLTLCGSGVTGCHGWVESNRDRAREEGFLVPLNGLALPADVMVRHHMWGPALLGDDGSLSFVGGGAL